jgi:hypothetical protein
VSNVSSCIGGTRIIVGWDPNHINLMILDQSPQVMHCLVESLNGELKFYCSFIYAHVNTVERRSLWKSFHKYSMAFKNSPWVILGDFNTTLDVSEKSSGSSKVTTGMSDFRDCISDIDMDDIAMNDLSFTWGKRPGKPGGLLKELDRVMGNVAFMFSFPTSYAKFLPFMISDHTHATFVIPNAVKPKPKPFKFHNYLSSKEGFMPAVKKVWGQAIEGFSMFYVVSKLKLLKKPLRKLNYEHGNLFDKVNNLRSNLASLQASLVVDPHSDSLREDELECLKAYRAALKDEESFLKQKAKTTWLKEGDRNSKYFHNVVKGKINKGRISMVEDLNVISFFGNDVGKQFVSHFKRCMVAALLLSRLMILNLFFATS